MFNLKQSHSFEKFVLDQMLVYGYVNNDISYLLCIHITFRSWSCTPYKCAKTVNKLCLEGMKGSRILKNILVVQYN